jgi:hypothetical protein
MKLFSKKYLLSFFHHLFYLPKASINRLINRASRNSIKSNDETAINSRELKRNLKQFSKNQTASDFKLTNRFLNQMYFFEVILSPIFYWVLFQFAI